MIEERLSAHSDRDREHCLWIMQKVLRSTVKPHHNALVIYILHCDLNFRSFHAISTVCKSTILFTASNQPTRFTVFVRWVVFFSLPLFCSLFFCARNSSKGVEIIVVVSSVALVFFLLFRMSMQLCFCSLLDAILSHKHGHNRCMWIQKKRSARGRKKTFFAVLSLRCFRLCFHTCNGWPNELNITSVVVIIIRWFYLHSFGCSVICHCLWICSNGIISLHFLSICYELFSFLLVSFEVFFSCT